MNPFLQCYISHTRLTALCPGLPGSAGTGQVKPMLYLLHWSITRDVALEVTSIKFLITRHYNLREYYFSACIADIWKSLQTMLSMLILLTSLKHA